MIAFVLLAASFSLASSRDARGVLGVVPSLGSTVRQVSAEAVSSARAAAVPVLEVVNHTASEARTALQGLSGDVTLAVVRARASGKEAAQCAQKKQEQAGLIIQEAMSKLDSCAALAAVEVGYPVADIEHLAQQTLQRLDMAVDDVGECASETSIVLCLLDVVRGVTQEVSAMTRAMSKQALDAEQSLANVVRYATSCATGQVQGARKLLQQLNIASCSE